MTSRLIGLFVSAVAITVLATPAAGQALPRAADGKPDFSGIWQALNTANWNILAHAADKDMPAGLGVVVGDEIPSLRPRAGEGDTLVFDVAQFTGQTWFDRSGNFHSAALHVVVIGVVSVQ